MPVTFNLEHLGKKNLFLQDVLPAEELDLDKADELIHLPNPLNYDLEVQRNEHNLLVQGKLSVLLACECSRCLKPFTQEIVLDPWVCHLSLEGEDQVAVINDCVDLTPYIREDIVLAFPQRPLCEADCQGLIELQKKVKDTSRSPEGKDQEASSPWSALDKLEL